MHVADILDQVETDSGLRNRLGEILARSAADFAPAPAAEPERTLPFFEVLADAIESQDPFMRGHARRTAFYATLLADRLCLSETEKRQVRLAAFLHDIGKIGVPVRAALARRAARGEGAQRDRAPSGGRRASDRAARRLAGLVAAVRHHHERWDGTGYPDRLAGDAIPLTARIVQIADAFDAMTGGTRPDRAGRSRAEALAELARCAGTQFDPTLVKEFAVVAEGAAGEVDLDLVADLVASTRSSVGVGRAVGAAKRPEGGTLGCAKQGASSRSTSGEAGASPHCGPLARRDGSRRYGWWSSHRSRGFAATSGGTWASPSTSRPRALACGRRRPNRSVPCFA